MGKFESASVVFEDERLIPDAAMPVQFWGTTHDEWTPIHKLYDAILRDAFETLRRCKSLGGRSDAAGILIDEVLLWMAGVPALVPFKQCCELLGLEPSAVRNAAQALERRGKKLLDT